MQHQMSLEINKYIPTRSEISAMKEDMSKYLISKKIRHVLEFDQMKYTAYRKKRK